MDQAKRHSNLKEKIGVLLEVFGGSTEMEDIVDLSLFGYTHDVHYGNTAD